MRASALVAGHRRLAALAPVAGRRRRTALALVACALCVAGLAAAAPASAGIFAAFQPPSRAIHCIYSAGSGVAPRVRCDTDYATRFRRRPARCMGDFGQSFELTARGRGRAICVTDSANVPGARVLPYDAVRRFGAISCVARRTGLRCYNSRGHGFLLSRARQLVY